jgi:hypothetical protein
MEESSDGCLSDFSPCDVRFTTAEYEVIGSNGAMVRTSKDMSSAEIQVLNKGSIIKAVEEIFLPDGKIRLRIISPIEGWISKRIGLVELICEELSMDVSSPSPANVSIPVVDNDGIIDTSVKNDTTMSTNKLSKLKPHYCWANSSPEAEICKIESIELPLESRREFENFKSENTFFTSHSNAAMSLAGGIGSNLERLTVEAILGNKSTSNGFRSRDARKRVSQMGSSISSLKEKIRSLKSVAEIDMRIHDCLKNLIMLSSRVIVTSIFFRDIKHKQALIVEAGSIDPISNSITNEAPVKSYDSTNLPVINRILSTSSTKIMTKSIFFITRWIQLIVFERLAA